MSNDDAKNRYLRERDDFLTYVNLLQEKVRRNLITYTQMLNLLDQVRPRTEHGKSICSQCCCVSMRHIFTHQPGDEKESSTKYLCEICGQEESTIEDRPSVWKTEGTS